jgi:dipeptidyl aminopeptidase/acylaminoacyl peptidase
MSKINRILDIVDFGSWWKSVPENSDSKSIVQSFFIRSGKPLTKVYHQVFHWFFIMVMSMGTLTGCRRNGSAPTSQPSTGDENSTSTSTTITTTLTPASNYQMTYISTCIDSHDCVYAMNIYDLETDHPRFDPPYLLFKLTKNGIYPQPPITQILWSPDGKQVILNGTGMEGKSDIFISDWSGENWVNITHSPLIEGGANWGVHGQKVFYIGKTDEFGHMRLFSVTTDGKNKEEIFPDTNLYMDEIDAFALSNGTKIAFTQTVSYLDDINAFTLSPDGTNMVFAKTINLTDQLFIVNLNGSNLRQLTWDLNDHFEPQFSPDGEWVLYSQEPGIWSEEQAPNMKDRLFLIRPDGSVKKEILVESLEWIAFCAWSPVGNWIAFMAEESGNYHIYIIRPDGTRLTQVSPSDINASFPAWRAILP